MLLRSFLWACVFVLTGSATAQDVSVRDEKQQQQKLDVLRSRISGLQARMRAAQGERSQLSKQLQGSEQKIGKLARRLRVLAGRLNRQQVRLQQLQKQAAQQQVALDQERKALAMQVRAAYAMGRQEQVKILLNQQDPAMISRVMAYYEYVNRERIERMHLIRGRLDSLLQTEQEIVAEEQKLQRLQVQRQAEKQAIETAQLTRREVIDKLANELKDQGRELSQLRDDEKQLQSLLRGLHEALSDVPAQPKKVEKFTRVRGKLNWPTRGVIKHSFGSPKIGQLRWDGVMIAANEGTEVRAIHHGRVAFADWLRGFGLLIIIDHGDGYMTLYGHNQSLFKEAGDWIDAGEPISAVGNTGGRKNSGVYFAIRRQGKAVNPAKWCKKARGRKVG